MLQQKSEFYKGEVSVTLVSWRYEGGSSAVTRDERSVTTKMASVPRVGENIVRVTTTIDQLKKHDQ